jgi:plastocyanin
LLALAMIVVPLAPTGGPAGAQETEVVEVDIVDFAFEPATLTVPAGATVVWTNRGDAPHTVTDGEGRFDSGALEPGDEFSVTFADPGTYRYACSFHPEMQATIVVTDGDAEAGDNTGDAETASRSSSASASGVAASDWDAVSASPSLSSASASPSVTTIVACISGWNEQA